MYFTKGLSPVPGLNLRLLLQILVAFYLGPWARTLGILQMVSVLALAELIIISRFNSVSLFTVVMLYSQKLGKYYWRRGKADILAPKGLASIMAQFWQPCWICETFKKIRHVLKDERRYKFMLKLCKFLPVVFTSLFFPTRRPSSCCQRHFSYHGIEADSSHRQHVVQQWTLDRPF